MSHDFTQLDWKPVLLVKVTRLPFGDTHTGLSVKRLSGYEVSQRTGSTERAAG